MVYFSPRSIRLLPCCRRGPTGNNHDQEQVVSRVHRPTFAPKHGSVDRTHAPNCFDNRPDVGRLTIVVHPEKCTGCGSCEVACSVRRIGRPSSAESSIQIIHSDSENLHTPVLCSKCEEAPCVRVCPGDALSRNKALGIITIDEKRCSTCSSCVLSCPFGVLHLGGSSQRPQPCDLCGGNPECVAACTTGAIVRTEQE
jgi:anaerobic carbon-monoxide dehydrogenase iron sulfur subunit